MLNILRKDNRKRIVLLWIALMTSWILSLSAYAAGPYLSAKDVVTGKNAVISLSLKQNRDPVKWSLKNHNVMQMQKINNNTVSLKGVQPGTAKVAATVKGITRTCTITICELQVSSASMKTGQTQKAALKGASLKEVNWTSSNSKVIKVSKTGKYTTTIKAAGKGKAKITAVCGGKKFSRYITVTDPAKKKKRIAVAYDNGGNSTGAYLMAYHSGYDASIVTSLSSTKGYDALILPGGADIDPGRYHQKYNGATGVNKYLDSIQFKLIDQFVKDKKPVLGLCRGQQLINVYFGGTLKQHINGHRFVNHSTIVLASSYLAKIIGTSRVVNSYHHQCVDKLGKGLTAIQWASDGTIEAVVHESLPVYGFQWHPEIGSYGTNTVNGKIMRYIMETKVA